MGDVLKLLYPPAPAPATTVAAGAGAAPGPPRRERRAEAEALKEVEVKVEEVEEVVICKLERAVEAAEGHDAAGGGERPGVKREREEAGPSGRDGAGRQPKRIWGASRFRGVYKDKKARTRPWTARIRVTEDGKGSLIYISSFAREEDAARAFDRVNIAAKGHAEAETNFPVAEYRAEWAQLEALGVDRAVAWEREHAMAERPDVMNLGSRFRGVSIAKNSKIKPWQAKIQVTEDGKRRKMHIGYFAREEDAARAYDRVSIAKLGHAKAKTNFPVADYRAEWAELKELGVDGAVAAERKKKDRSDPPEPPSKRRRVTEKTQSKLTAFFGLGAVGGKGGFRLHL